MKRAAVTVTLVGGFLLSVVGLGVTHVRADSGEHHDNRAKHGDSRVQEGLRLAPVPLDLHRRNRELVGLGSYIVNAVANCSECHTCPSFTPGHNPYGPPFGPPGGGDGQVNSTNYLAGGTPFFPPGVHSANLTPDGDGPGGLSFQEFATVLRTGHDPDGSGRILQVMPWPGFRKMTDRDIRAIYEYLSAIPHATPGMCVAPGQ